MGGCCSTTTASGDGSIPLQPTRTSAAGVGGAARGSMPGSSDAYAVSPPLLPAEDEPTPAEQAAVTERKRVFKESLRQFRAEEQLFASLARQTAWPLPVIRRVHALYTELTASPASNRSGVGVGAGGGIGVDVFAAAIGVSPKSVFAQRLFQVFSSAHVRSKPVPSPHSTATTPSVGPSPRMAPRVATEKKRREPSDHVLTLNAPPQQPQPQAIDRQISSSEVDANPADGKSEAAVGVGVLRPPRPLAITTTASTASITTSSVCSFLSFTLACYAFSSSAPLELRVRTAFAVLDLNDDGFVDWTELRAILRSAYATAPTPATGASDAGPPPAWSEQQLEAICRETIRSAAVQFGLASTPATTPAAGNAGSASGGGHSSSLTVPTTSGKRPSLKHARTVGAGSSGSLHAPGSSDGRSASPLPSTVEEEPALTARALSALDQSSAEAGRVVNPTPPPVIAIADGEEEADTEPEAISPQLAAATRAAVAAGSPRQSRQSRFKPPQPLTNTAPAVVSSVSVSKPADVSSITVFPANGSLTAAPFSVLERIDIQTFTAFARASPHVLSFISDPIDRWLALPPAPPVSVAATTTAAVSEVTIQLNTASAPPTPSPPDADAGVRVSPPPPVLLSADEIATRRERGLKLAQQMFAAPLHFRASSDVFFRDSAEAVSIQPASTTERLNSFTLAVEAHSAAAGNDDLNTLTHRRFKANAYGGAGNKPARQASHSISSANHSRRRGSFSVEKNLAAAGAEYAIEAGGGGSFSELN